MKKVITTLLFAIIINLSFAQTTSPEVIATAGDYYSNSNMSLSWTIGEAIVETQSTGTVILTQGFHQGLDSIVVVEEYIEQPIVIVFPNPTADYINIDIKGNSVDNYQIQLFDELGQILIAAKYSEMKQINLLRFKKATYFLKVLDVGSNTHNTYKILKK